MTQAERIMLGRLLDKHRVRAIEYSEVGIPGGLYKVSILDKRDREKIVKIYGREL